MTVVNGSDVVVAQSVAELVGASAVTSGSVVRVPAQEGHWLQGMLVLSTRETAAHRRCAVLADGGEVLAAGPWSAVAVYRQDMAAQEVPDWALTAARHAWEQVDAATAEAAAHAGAGRGSELVEVERQRDAARAELSALQQRLDAIVNSAHEYADENNLCGEFDRFMESHGLPGRTREFSCPVTVTVTARVRTRASSPEAALASLTDSQVREAVLAARFRGLEWAAAGQAMPR